MQVHCRILQITAGAKKRLVSVALCGMHFAPLCPGSCTLKPQHDATRQSKRDVPEADLGLRTGLEDLSGNTT
jgi:hypothetical protein